MSPTLIDFLATGFYSGRSPKMPGTCGTAVIALLVFLSSYVFGEWYVGVPGILVALLTTVVAVVVANQALALSLYGECESGEGKADPQKIVIDEWVGYLIAICVPSGGVTTLILGFFLFRLFDILKPPPVSTAERLPGGLGIVADDFVAGIMANITLRIIFVFV